MENRYQTSDKKAITIKAITPKGIEGSILSAPITHKTPQLLKLLTGGSAASNPLLDEDFKAEVIRARENPEPVKPVAAKDGGTQINITTELVSQWLPKISERFRLCSCPRCQAELTVEALDMIRPVIVRVKSESDLERARKLKADKQQGVLMQLIRLAVSKRDAPKHDKK